MHVQRCVCGHGEGLLRTVCSSLQDLLGRVAALVQRTVRKSARSLAREPTWSPVSPLSVRLQAASSAAKVHVARAAQGGIPANQSNWRGRQVPVVRLLGRVPGGDYPHAAAAALLLNIQAGRRPMRWRGTGFVTAL